MGLPSEITHVVNLTSPLHPGFSGKTPAMSPRRRELQKRYDRHMRRSRVTADPHIETLQSNDPNSTDAKHFKSDGDHVSGALQMTDESSDEGATHNIVFDLADEVRELFAEAGSAFLCVFRTTIHVRRFGC